MPNRSDNFNRANTTAGLGTPSDGGSDWVEYTLLGDPWGISSFQAYDVYDGGARQIAVLECGSADADVQVTIATFGDFMVLAARVTDINNFIAVIADSGAGYRLSKFVLGVPTTLDSDATTPANGDVVTLSMSGNSLEVFVNAVSLLTATDSFNNTETRHGLFASNAYVTGARWDTFSITVGSASSPWFYRPHTRLV